MSSMLLLLLLLLLLVLLGQNSSHKLTLITARESIQQMLMIQAVMRAVCERCNRFGHIGIWLLLLLLLLLHVSQ
jgi:hypothetical protein